MGSLLCFDMNNVRYLTATQYRATAARRISSAALRCFRGTTSRFCGISVRRPGIIRIVRGSETAPAPASPLLRGAMSPEMGRAENVGQQDQSRTGDARAAHEPVGIDVIEPPILFALQREGIHVLDGQQLMSDARAIKSQDGIALLNHSAAMVDGAYHELYHAMRPGFKRMRPWAW